MSATGDTSNFVYLRNTTKAKKSVRCTDGDVYYIMPRSKTWIPGPVWGALPEGVVEITIPTPAQTPGAAASDAAAPQIPPGLSNQLQARRQMRPAGSVGGVSLSMGAVASQRGRQGPPSHFARTAPLNLSSAAAPSPAAAQPQAPARPAAAPAGQVVSPIASPSPNTNTPAPIPTPSTPGT